MEKVPGCKMWVQLCTDGYHMTGIVRGTSIIDISRET